MNYWRLRYMDKGNRRRAIGKLQALRGYLAEKLPRRTADGTLVLGTWNIRNFDDNRFGHGPRLEEAFFYIAEVISRFDAIAVQEINDDLAPVDRLMGILGHEYDFLLTDVTTGRSGNDERLGFIFNREKVSFRGIAGEIVLPERLLISNVTKKLQFARTPFACSFQSGWLKFFFATVHIYYGSASKKSDAYKRRVAEIQKVAEQLAKRAREEEHTYILVGDFNIDDLGDPTADALEQAGFEIFRNKIGSNRTKTKFYDQISTYARPGEIRLGQAENSQGVLSLFDVVFAEADFPVYDADVRASLTRQLKAQRKERSEWEAKGPSKSRTKKLQQLDATIAKTTETRSKKAKREAYYLSEWRTYQLSDHLPLWVELDVDFTADYLNKLRK